MWKVSYLHYMGTYGHPYRVARTYDTREAAQEFIDVNAMVYPLPGVRLEEVYPPMTRVELHDALVPLMGYEETAYALAAIDEYGEVNFDRHDAKGTMHYRAAYEVKPGITRYYTLTGR